MARQVARNVGWTEVALEDLEATAAFIARDSEHYAQAMVRDAFDGSDSLAKFAERGRVVPEIHDPNVRELFVGSYRLIYEVRKHDAVVLAFIHGARVCSSDSRRRDRAYVSQSTTALLSRSSLMRVFTDLWAGCTW